MLTRMRKIHVFNVALPLEPVQALNHSEPGLLHDLLCGAISGDVETGHPQEARAQLVRTRQALQGPARCNGAARHETRQS
jgi:hypothetical protein